MRLTFHSIEDLTRALERAAGAHDVHEEAIGHPDTEWPNWYAQFIQSEQLEDSCARLRRARA
jgi:hypothetical protein